MNQYIFKAQCLNGKTYLIRCTASSEAHARICIHFNYKTLALLETKPEILAAHYFYGELDCSDLTKEDFAYMQLTK